ncbi:MAG: hydroxyacid dehydrogenase [Spirochaetales bacterium]
MQKFTVLLPQPIEDEAKEILEKAKLEVLLAPDPKPETVAPLMKKTQAIVLRTGITITRDLLGAATDLWTISRTGGGVDNVDLEAATERGVIVTSSLGANTSSVIEHALSLILSLSKKLCFMDREVRKGNFAIRYKNLPRDLQGRTLGVLGFGRIGSGLAEICHRAFQMGILANDEYLSEEKKASYKEWVSFVSKEELFRRSDIVSIHIPLTEETKGSINAALLSFMKPDALLINTSRGGVISEKDLIEALEKRKIAGAGLDVFEQEPPSPDNPLLRLENVLLTPHSAALTKECVVRMAVAGAQRVVDLFNGKIPEHIANPEVLHHPRWKQYFNLK